jgi:hypothetical protein
LLPSGGAGFGCAVRAQRTANSDPFQDAQSSKVRCPLWYSCASVRWQRQLRSELRPGATFDFKPVTREYADALRAVGLHVVSCYQYGKPGWPTPSDFTRGYDGGVADAQTALRLHAAAGGPDSAPIFFSIDEDIDVKTWKSVAAEWLRGINSVLGVERTGVYGHAGYVRGPSKMA